MFPLQLELFDPFSCYFSALSIMEKNYLLPKVLNLNKQFNTRMRNGKYFGNFSFIIFKKGNFILSLLS